MLVLDIMVGLAVALKLITELYLEYLNRKNLFLNGGHLPQEFTDFINEEDFRKSIDYSFAKSTPNLVEFPIDALLLIVILYSGITPWFYETVTLGLNFLPGIWQDSFFIFSLFWFIGILTKPLEWYRTFSLEARFGFNTMTWKLWIVDFIKHTLISAILTLPLLAGLFYLVEAAGKFWWVWGWGGFIIFQFLMFLIYPQIIMPWFNKFTPLPEGELREAIFNLSRKLKFPAREIMVMDGSKRSRHSNAFFTGIGKGRRVVFFDTLVEQLNTKEMKAVFAHEVGHFKKKHILKMMLIMILQLFLFFFLADVFKDFSGFNENFGLTSGNLSHTLILLSLLSGVVLFWFKPLSNIFSRRHEFEADRFAREAMASDERELPLISALKKLYKENLGNLIPHPWYSFFYYSHPVLVERIRALKNYH